MQVSVSCRVLSSRPRPLACNNNRWNIVARGLKENVAGLPSIDHVKQVVIHTQPEPWTIPNAPGKKASVAIYAYLASEHGGRLTPPAAEKGLRLYDEYVEEALKQPGSHPNIDLLFQVIQDRAEYDIVVEQ